ncbi:MAG: UMP kinase [Candidatus Thermoplasmatota archaeon]|nr:UMP kinase [Candidatus Thermoplasmatota archaeon]
MKTVVVSIGGSILVPEASEVDNILEIAALLDDMSEDVKLYVVVGGGRYARTYIGFGRSLGADERHLDSMGIEFTRLNADLLRLALEGSGMSEQIPKTVRRAHDLGKKHSIVVMGGTVPGHTTDAVSAMLAQEVKADLVVNATSVDGVYTADPKKNRNAKKIERMSYGKLLGLVEAAEGKAGAHVPFDPKGSRILARLKIPLIIVDGNDLDALKSAILGDASRGTLVS